MKINLFFILTLFFPLFSTAYTLEELQNMAVNSRELLNKYKDNVKMASQDVRIAEAGYLPSIDISYTLNVADRTSLTHRDKQNSTINGSVSYNLFSGFGDTYNVQANKQIFDSRKLQVLSGIQAIKHEVALYFTDIYVKIASIEVSQKKYEAYIQLYSQRKKRFEVGLLNGSELLKIKVEQDDTFIVLQIARADLQKSINELNSILPHNTKKRRHNLYR
ncbi:MAG: TolC family protein [Sulfurimonas sp.]|nr:TolC family protein [Sulfurimonas sp.]